MKINITTDITIKELIENYQNFKIDGVYAFNNKLEVRPPYQREFIYEPPQQVALIDSILHNYPIGLIYWCKKDDGTYECLDGQQRIISICEFAQNSTIINIDGKSQNYQSLKNANSPYIDTFLNYKLIVAICEGTNSEKLDWFETINIAGKPLTAQELRNAIYSGPWITAAKKYFSHDKCTAWHRTTKTYGNLIDEKRKIERQEWLEQILIWKIEHDNIDTSNIDKAICDYMLSHKDNTNADDLISYFEDMVSWVKRNFKYKDLMKKCNWGNLYNKYKNIDLKLIDTDIIINDLIKNAKNDGITNPKGIYEYIFDGNLSHLSDRAFPKEIKQEVWDLQDHKCAVCKEEFDFEDMAGDHILPWSKGGTTTIKNCQMLCTSCNSIKSNKLSKEAKDQVQNLRLKV